MLNPVLIALEPEYHGNNRDKLPVIGSSGITPVSGNYNIKAGVDWPAIAARELFLSNDTSNDITIDIVCSGGDLSWILHDGETFNERIPPFTSVVVAAQATGLGWRWYVRGNLT